MRLILRKRIQPYGASETWTEANFEQNLAPTKTAIVITDMWDKHWCRGATERVGQIAVRMEPLLEKARAAGVLIIHAPSETMDFYGGSEGRKLAQSAPHVDPPEATAPLHDPPLPIDDSNGGCDTPGDTEHRAWSRETPLLTIAPGDVISDSGTEIYNVLRQRGIDTVFLYGRACQHVHPQSQLRNSSVGAVGHSLHSRARPDRCHVRAFVASICFSCSRNGTRDSIHRTALGSDDHKCADHAGALGALVLPEEAWKGQLIPGRCAYDQSVSTSEVPLATKEA